MYIHIGRGNIVLIKDILFITDFDKLTSTERGKNMLNCICKKLGFASLGYQSIEGLLEAIGLPEDCVCTYCWTGKE